MLPGAALGAILVLFIINRKPPAAEKAAKEAAAAKEAVLNPYQPVPLAESINPGER